MKDSRNVRFPPIPVCRARSAFDPIADIVATAKHLLMRPTRGLATLLLLGAPMLASTMAFAREPAGLHQALDDLARKGKFSGAVVVRGRKGVRFARGYGWADPF